MSLNSYNKCTHYNRKCKIFAECCFQYYDCHMCHNEYNIDHTLNKSNIEMVQCLKCFNVQCFSDRCEKCDLLFANYYCLRCKILDNKSSYHCKKCNICQYGKKSDYIHCNLCKYCIDTEEYDEHICINNSINDNCPICLISMENCDQSLKILLCGHALHQNCYIDHLNLVKQNKKRKRTIIYTCPICRTIVFKKKASDQINNISIIDLTNDDLSDEYMHLILDRNTRRRLTNSP